MGSMKFLQFFCDFSQNFLVYPPSNFHGKQILMCFTSVKNFVNFGGKMPIHGMLEKFGIFTIRAKIATLPLVVQK